MPSQPAAESAEHIRLRQNDQRTNHWKRWGPYLSERAWGTVREDYSADGDAWEYFPHDHARSRAYRWNEDGIAGICDRHQRICFALALWNGRDPILKERLFGLTGNEGNHGEDVKEYYFYLDTTPTHSYMRCLYKYPQAPFPYDAARAARTAGAARDEPRVRAHRHRRLRRRTATSTCSSSTRRPTPEDILVRITVANRGPEPRRDPPPADCLVPQHAGRGTARDGRRSRALRSRTARGHRARGADRTASAGCYVRRQRRNCSSRRTRPTRSGCSACRTRRPTSRTASTTTSCTARADAVNPAETGTKAAAHYRVSARAGGEPRPCGSA